MVVGRIKAFGSQPFGFICKAEDDSFGLGSCSVVGGVVGEVGDEGLVGHYLVGAAEQTKLIGGFGDVVFARGGKGRR